MIDSENLEGIIMISSTTPGNTPPQGYDPGFDTSCPACKASFRPKCPSCQANERVSYAKIPCDQHKVACAKHATRPVEPKVETPVPARETIVAGAETEVSGFVPEPPASKAAPPAPPAPFSLDPSSSGDPVLEALTELRRRQSDPVYDAQRKAEKAAYESARIEICGQRVHPSEAREKLQERLDESHRCRAGDRKALFNETLRFVQGALAAGLNLGGKEELRRQLLEMPGARKRLVAKILADPAAGPERRAAQPEPPPMPGPRVAKTVRLPAEFWQRIHELARTNRRTTTREIEIVISRHLEATQQRGSHEL
jgi:hypothetical protein